MTSLASSGAEAVKVSGSMAFSVSGGVASFINGASYNAVAWSVASTEETETGRSKSCSPSWSYATDISAQNLQSSFGENKHKESVFSCTLSLVGKQLPPSSRLL